MPSPNSINESHRAQRVSPSRNPHLCCNPFCRLTHVVRLQKRFALCLAPRRMRAAFFAYFFLLLKKSRSPKASKATHDAFGPNALEKRATSVRVGAYQNLVSFHLGSNWYRWPRACPKPGLVEGTRISGNGKSISNKKIATSNSMEVAISLLVEAAGIEPASESGLTTASTCVVYLSNLASRAPTDRVAGMPARFYLVRRPSSGNSRTSLLSSAL